MTVRRFTEQDAEAVSELIVRTLRISNAGDYPAETIEELVRAETPEHVLQRASWTHFYVAVEGNEIIGCGAIGPYWGKDDESSLFTIFVHPDYQGKGIGRAVVETLERDEFALRARRIEIPASITGLPFYLKMGYTFKDGKKEPDEERLYRLEKHRVKNGITVRQAEKEDVRQIAEILVEDWQKAYRGIIDGGFLDSLTVDERYGIEIKRYQKLLVAAGGDRILGYVWPEEKENGPADCEVVALYVRYSDRNSGIGKLLLRHAAGQFRKDGKKKMIIWCLKENYESRRFYEKTGGREFRTGSHNWGGKEYEMISYLYDLE